MLLNAIIMLHKQIQSMPLGVNREQAARAAEAAALQATPTILQRGLLAGSPVERDRTAGGQA